MKKLTLLLAALLAVLGTSAQKKWSFGPKAGINIADINLKIPGNDDVVGTKTGLLAGAFVEFRPIKWFAASVDVLYSSQGAKSTYEDDKHPDSTQDYEYRLQYLNVPVMANIYLTQGLALKAGIQPGFQLGAEFRHRKDKESWHEDDLKDDMKSVEIALPVGISYTMDCGLIIDVRYNIPLTSIATDITDHLGRESKKMTNRVFALTLGWKF